MMDKHEQFTKLYNQYGAGIRKLCQGYLGDPAMAEDLVQDTFITVWNNLHDFRGEAKWSTWIYRIAVNTCLMYKRKDKKQVLFQDVLMDIPQEQNELEQQLQLLYKSISQLKEADRLIIMLTLEDKPYPEIAQITGFSEGNLRVKIHRIKKELTEIFKRNGQL
jgi:RNA polymerase sigma factor (sigma-70 family)